VATILNLGPSRGCDQDQGPVTEIDVHQGIEDTISTFGQKLQRGIQSVGQYDRNLPTVQLPASELSQE
jgi:hypothetical protein